MKCEARGYEKDGIFCGVGDDVDMVDGNVVWKQLYICPKCGTVRAE